MGEFTVEAWAYTTILAGLGLGVGGILTALIVAILAIVEAFRRIQE